ncbi:hypothetical protein FHX82_000544 [Amycolatopsis bartoniae]|uniref:Sulfotransferase domain-containing protein n=1 Tax=Amycolatopsis bartoniae TaxID=941986 RepID=A0A8H9MEB8_9PSEU|nr:sulfotransferase domain-containing protein [Amycolatopsis bartoniae]MBB2933524.1 hypothetical protein [Amycolatopsis bartoniae]TVT07621.1 sulfotransferase domain-containing protein [Amycolatopsis bartoniae]GHF60086.1 hypothetical protein GCM10017566_37130 [Amycolatopsis bartoniae]
MKVSVDDGLHQHLVRLFGTVLEENLPRIGHQDVVVVGYPGSGKTILANVLRLLRLNYAYAVTERLSTDGSNEPVSRYADYLQRLDTDPASDGLHRPPPRLIWPRFVKTPLPPQYFNSRSLYGAWALVRDPRDNVYSYYQHLYPQLPASERQTFADWLASSDFLAGRPVDVWHYTYRGWLEQAAEFGRTAVTRFEDLKRDPVGTMDQALRAFDIDVDESALTEAAELSSFEHMRKHEEEVLREEGRAAENGRMVRRGKVGEWREWMTPELWAHFADPDLIATAKAFGYDLSPP